MPCIFTDSDQLLHHVSVHRGLAQQFIEIHQPRGDGNSDSRGQDSGLYRQCYERFFLRGSLQLFQDTRPVNGAAEKLSL